MMKEVKKCASLQEVRQEIDVIDEALLALLARRSAYVRQVVAFKGRAEIVDEARIEAIIRRQQSLAQELAMDGEAVADIWRMMIARFITMEEELFDRKSGAE